MLNKDLRFPDDLFLFRDFPGRMGKTLREIEPFSMFPPYPWGEWAYGCVYQKCCRDLRGDLIELGVGLGGMSFFLARLAEKDKKKVFCYDSFAGLPAPNPLKDNPGFKTGDYRGARDRPDLFGRFRDNAEVFGLSESVVPVKGFFQQTLKKITPRQKFCFAHLDSDLYDSVFKSLEAVYDRVVNGGVIVIDDFFHHAQGPARAVADFFNSRKIRPILHLSFPYSVFLIKGDNAPTPRHRSLDGNCYSFEWLKRDKIFREQLRKSLARAKDNPRIEAKCEALIQILSQKYYSNSDIYKYWESMADFWDSFSPPKQDVYEI